MTIPVITIDCGDSVPELRQIVLRELEMRGLYRNNHVYRGFNAELIRRVRCEGVENPESRWIYANSEEYLKLEPDPMFLNPLKYALSYGFGALAVYRGELVRQSESCTYQFVGPGIWPDALVAIFRLV